MKRFTVLMVALLGFCLYIPLRDGQAEAAPAIEPNLVTPEIYTGESGSFVTFIGPTTNVMISYAMAKDVQQAADKWISDHPDVKVVGFSACGLGDKVQRYMLTLRIEKK